MHCLGELVNVINVDTRPLMNQPCQAALDSNDNRGIVTQMVESYSQQLMKKPAECISGSGVSGVQHYRHPRVACALRQIITDSETITKSHPTTGRWFRLLPRFTWSASTAVRASVDCLRRPAALRTRILQLRATAAHDLSHATTGCRW
jgi:hypothetical protein